MKAYYTKIEMTLYFIVWALIFLMPYWLRSNEPLGQTQLFHRWIHLSVFLLIFVVNFFFLAPKFLMRKKYSKYVMWTVVFVFVTILSYIYLRRIENFNPLFLYPVRNMSRFIKDFTDNFIIGLLIIGLGASAQLIKSWISEQSVRFELEREQLKTNLDLLKNKVSPHFFMNTLNNIHALIDIDSQKAKDSVILLSTMMRYLLYESSQEKISLRKEVEFIESYISLMKLRYNDKVKVEMRFPDNTGAIKIPPMLFASYLENAFKYGINFNHYSDFLFEIRIDGDYLVFKVVNGVFNANLLNDYGGLGMSNTKQTLDLLYGEKYKLVINQNDKFDVELTIPL